MLLGEYTDDEFDEEVDQHADRTSADNSSAYHNDQANESMGQEYKDMEVNAESLTVQPVKQPDLQKITVISEFSENLEGNDDTRLEDAGDSCKDTFVAGSSDVQVVGDVGSGWKIVMHEASDKYYYWNVETGETSWEVPVLTKETGLNNEPKTSNLYEDLDASSIMIASNTFKETSQMEKLIEGSKTELLESENLGPDVISNELKSHCHGVCVPSHGTTSFENNLVPEQLSDGLMDDESLHINGFKGATTICDDMTEGPDRANGLVKYGEYLLERLKSLDRSLGILQRHEWMSKYIFEVEIRLSDCKSLASHGSSLLPFWVYSECRLKKLENCINDYIRRLSDSDKTNEVETRDVSRGQTEPRHSMGQEYAADGNEKTAMSVLSPKNDVASPMVHTVALDSCDVHGNGVFAEHVSLLSHETIYPRSCAEGNHEELSPKPHLEDGEIDMDVDMEVEDEPPRSNTTADDEWGAKDTALSQPLVQPYPPENFHYFASDDGLNAPALPDEEWIPPPPPDNEPVPPPPPDEPPETSYPPLPSYIEAAQHPSYIDQYSISHPNTNYQYYGPAITEVPSGNFYGHGKESLVGVPHPPLYYQTGSSVYPNTVPLNVDTVESVVYYPLQEEKVPHFPVVSGVGSSELHVSYSESVPMSYGTVPSDPNVYIAAPTAATPVEKNVISIGGSGSEVVSAASVHAPAMITLKDSAPLTLTDLTNSSGAPDAKSATTTVQSKALRGKKRTVAVVSTMRSNKKVSSLVDKWKAAKEEMHEDEPEDALEALEKKKQREIEQWRAQQIASGEAKDNANFQPLGGDWRDRVKRRRAQLARAAKQSSSPEANDQNQQPNLIELSKDLPSGWQAYYDEASKKVYYGNVITSDTSWTRPTK